MSEPFVNVIGSEDELRELYRLPASTTQQKVQPRLDKHARAFIEASPFVLIGTTSPDGTGDVSPKGGPPGFVVTLDDDHIAVPDLAGNNLLDSIGNIVRGSGIGMLFLVPGVDETLRVNGYACVTTDVAVLDACAVKDRRPEAAIGVTVTQQYMHCAKAFRRSDLWDAQSWPQRDALPSLGCILVDQIELPDGVTAEVVDANLERGYAESMWEPGGKP